MISYRPGSWFGIVGEHATVLLPPSEKARAGTLWALVDDGAGFDEVLDALLEAGLRALPGFVLLATDDTTTRIVVRGPSRATFQTLGGEAVVEGSTSATWVEKTLREVSGMSIVLEESDEPLLTLHNGLVRLAALTSPAQPATATAPAPGNAAPAVPAPVVESVRTDPASGPYAAVLPFPAATPVAPIPPAPSAPPAPPAPPADPGLPEIDPLDPLGSPAGVLPVEEPPAAEVSDELDVPSWASASASSDPLTDRAEDVASQEDDESWADEPTGVIPVVPAEDDAADQHASSEPPAWTPPTPDASGAALPGAVPPPPPFPPAPPAGGPTPIPPAPLSPPTPPTPQDDHDGLTHVGEPEQSQPSADPAAHDQSVARLEFAHGERVDVDRVVIVGRAPEAGRFSHADQPRLVAVPSPHQEISSTHIEIRPGSGVDHGTAVVTDLGSTNGTVVVQPGLGPEELRPGVPVQLAPGAMIDLGDGMTIRVTQP